jgi:hypothetical protein
MKKLYAVFAMFLFLKLSTLAQWDLDPNNPGIVCNEFCTQMSVSTFTDGNGGAYVFWRDTRTSCGGNYYYDIYGQHYNNSGMKMWEETGRLIYDLPSSVLTYAIQPAANNGEFIIGAHTGYNSSVDSLRFQKIDANGTKLWTNDLLVAFAEGCTGNYFLGIENFNFVKTNAGYTVNFVPTYCGGADGCRLTSFNESGVLTGPLHGSPEGQQYYIGARGIANTYDGTDDVYVYHTNGNGQGAHAVVMRITADGDSAFAPIDVLEGTDGLNYQYEAMSDENGIAVAYCSNGGTSHVNIYMRKLNPDGTWAWNGNTVNVCVEEGLQSSFYWTQDDEYYYIVWGDGRPGVVGYYAIYGQKILKATGETIWTNNGKLIVDTNTYYPEPKITLTSQGNLLVTFQASIEPYYNARLLDTDGEPIWSNAVSIAGSSFSPFYDDNVVISSNDNMIVTWAKTNPSGGSDGIYIARITEPDNTTYISQTLAVCDEYVLNGTSYSQSGTYDISLPGDTLLTLDLTVTNVTAQFTTNGNLLTYTGASGIPTWIDCSNDAILASNQTTFTPEVTGEYALVVELNSCVDTSACQMVTVIGVEKSKNNFQINIFPNPTNEILNISFMGNDIPSELNVYDGFGKKVITEKIYSSSTTLHLESISEGIYYLSYVIQGKSFQAVFVKE